MVKIVNIDSLEWNETSVSDSFGAKNKRIAMAADPCGIGASMYQLEPGKRAFPYHMHYGNDEVLWILAGEGTLRYGDKNYPLKKGDYVALPKGTGLAHQLINTSEDLLEYVCLSTMNELEVCLYPDSDKIAAYHTEPGQSPRDAKMVHILKRTPAGYWDGELD